MKLIEFRLHVDVDGGESLQTDKRFERAEGASSLISGVSNLVTAAVQKDGVLEVGKCENRVGYQLVPGRRILSASVEIISVSDVDGPEERLNAITRAQAVGYNTTFDPRYQIRMPDPVDGSS